MFIDIIFHQLHTINIYKNIKVKERVRCTQLRGSRIHGVCLKKHVRVGIGKVRGAPMFVGFIYGSHECYFMAIHLINVDIFHV